MERERETDTIQFAFGKVLLPPVYKMERTEVGKRSGGPSPKRVC